MKKTLFAGIAAACLASTLHAMDDVQIHGFVSQGFIHSDRYNYLTPGSQDGSFEFAEYGLNVSKQLNEKLRIGMQLFARDLGDQGNNDITIDWAYADYRIGDNSGLRIGKMHTPVGFYNVGRDVDLLRTTILLPQSVYSEALRDVYSFRGIQAYTNFELTEDSSLDLNLFTGAPQIEEGTPFVEDAFYGALAAAGTPATAKAMIDGASNTADIKDYWGYQAILNTGIEGLRIGISDAFGEINSRTSARGGNAISYDMKHYRMLSAEYNRDRISIRHERYSGEFTILGANLQTEAEGNYTQLTYDTYDQWQFSIYKDEQYPDALNRKNKNAPNNYSEDLAFSVRYDVDDNFILKAEWHDMEGTGNLRAIQNVGTPIGALAQKDWDVFLMKATFFF